MRPVSRRLPLALLLTLAAASLPTVGCDDGDDAGTPTVDPKTAPFVGDLPALPADVTFEPADGMPVVPGGVWRYRVRAEDWQAPPYPIDRGGETTVTAFTGEAPGLVDDEAAFLRTTSTVIVPGRRAVSSSTSSTAMPQS